MSRNSLPSQILYLIFAVIFAVLATLWAALYIIRLSMNEEAARESKIIVDSRVMALQREVALIASDYHNWTDLYEGAASLDFEELSTNYGITAERGDIFQYAQIFDGPFAAPISWQAGMGLDPQDGFISHATMLSLKYKVSELDFRDRQTANYFEVRNGDLIMFSSSYLLPEDDQILSGIPIDQQAIAVIGKALSSADMVHIGNAVAKKPAMVVFSPVEAESVSIPALGIDGNPVAWLTWEPNTPGTILFKKMSPIMGAVSLIFISASCWGAWLLRDKAEKLVEREAISFDQARTDALTGLPNRFSLLEHFDKILEVGSKNCAIVSIDLDRFKIVNDTVGHVGGDAFLRNLGLLLRSIQDGETFVARVGGDEFVIVISSDVSIEQIIERKSKVLLEMSDKQILCNGVCFGVQASKGLAVMNSGELQLDELLRRADRAMYSAKSQRSQAVLRYDEVMERSDKERKYIEQLLRCAIDGVGGFSIQYQPIVRAEGPGSARSYEALARWSVDGVGAIPPDKFIDVAESNGLIVPLGWLLFDLIFSDLKHSNLGRVSINVSPVQLTVPGFSRQLLKKATEFDLRPEQVELEVTEQIVFSDDTTVWNELTHLKKSGFSLALDDFGTGYSSIGYLTRMPFDVLKIDRSFVNPRGSTQQFQRVIASIVNLARAMDLTVVAEGIETSEQASYYSNLGCDFLQGYFYGRPSPISEFSDLIAASEATCNVPA